MNRRKKILTAMALSFAFTCMAVAIVYTVHVASQDVAFYTAVEDVLTLKQGSRGETVKQIQQKLKRWGYYTGAIDGVFGAKTRSAVVLFQKRNGLVAEGIVGKKTLQALGI